MASLFVSFSYPFVLIVITLSNFNSAENVFPKTTDEPCVCVPFYQCSNDTSGEVVTDGRFLLDQRSLRGDFVDRIRCLFTVNNNYLRGHQFKLSKENFRTSQRHSFLTNRIFERWNRLQSIVVDAGTVNAFKNALDLFDARTTYLIYGVNQCPGDFDVCCRVGNVKKNTPKKTTKSPVTSPRSRGCGYHEDDILNWAATMLYQRPDKVFPPTYKCGASIIHKDAVVTAAHCLEEEGYYFIKIGGATRKLYSISIHPEFEMGSLQHDIAVITLRKLDDKPQETVFSCISDTLNVPNNTQCIAATFNAEKNKLEKIQVPFVDSATCTQRLSTTRLGKFFELHESFVCAGGSDKDTCVGDGGNPLICPIPGQPGRYNQVGIVSWGIGCGKKGIPGVYVNISHVRDWIDSVLEHFGKDTKGYKN